MDNLFSKDALQYHESGRPGKIEVIPTKPYQTQRDLSLAYSPGVADPCLAIHANPADVYKYTAKRNLVAVISNGTAVLGLGDIGPEASKPVMEGKGLLFKIFADVDVFDIEVDAKDIDKFVETVVNIAPTFGGINLEDIKAPECFEIEDRIKAAVDIPVMHDDQHGTAIISSAGLLNALEISGKKIDEVKIVVNGAGASAISCTKLYILLGVKPENVVMCDSKGVIHADRTDLNKYKQQFATTRNVHTLTEALVDADVFLGLSVGGALKSEMLEKMAPKPIVFALANPTPEIHYHEAVAVRNDIIMGTGRSDYPNQVNNVLGFPFIFRGALDVEAREINDEMKLAASRALAALAKEPVPEEVNIAYNTTKLHFGKDYIIPKPTDPRLIEHVAPAVAKAAMETGVAGKPIEDWNKYLEELRKRLGMSNPLIRQIKTRAKADPKRIVFANPESYKMLKAAEIVINEQIAHPVLLGSRQKIQDLIHEFEFELGNVEIIDPSDAEEQLRLEKFAHNLYEKRSRKGMTLHAARERMKNREYIAPMLVETGYADGMISGLTNNYPSTISPALQTIGRRKGVKYVSGMYIINRKEGPLFFADTTINKITETEHLVEVALRTAEAVRKLHIEPRIAMLAYSNFGSTQGSDPCMARDAVKKLHNQYPELIVDGEVQANVALNNELMQENFPFSKLADAPANTLIFPGLSAGNIAYKLIQELTDYDVIGPVINGLDKSVHVLPIGSSVNDIVNMVTISVVDSQCLKDPGNCL